jgi:DNA repair protein SbcC/Rad50
LRILAIRARNLASLPRFEVDLTKGALARTRIFAITGPTGAGKSTLLDALCLALYDRAPRLGGPRDVPVGDLEVSASDPRSLMRRGATEASSEVDFLARDQRRYRATWEVWRARKKSAGKLQSQRMRLVCLDDQKDLTGGTKTETLSLIEHLIGLSYDEFRRAVLLAQGDFATFLKARMDERAELLEKMTGTEIYAEISRAAFQRSKSEEETLRGLEAKLESVSPMPDAERSALEASIERLGAERRALDVSADAARRAARRDEAIAQLFDDIEAKRSELARARDDWERTFALRAELSKARDAERMRGAFEANLRAESAAEEAKARLAGAEAARSSAEDEARNAARRVERARATLESRSRESRELEPDIERAKRLDVQLEEAMRRATSLAGEASARAEAEREADRAREAALSAVEAAEHRRNETASWLTDHRALEPLAAEWSRWSAALERHRALVDARARRAKEKTKAERALNGAEAARSRAQEALDRTNEAIAALAAKTEARKKALEAHRKREAPSLVREAVERIARELASLDGMKAIGKETRRFTRQIAEETELAEAEKKAAAAARAEAEARAPEMSELEAQLAVHRAEKTLAEARIELAARRAELLRDGEPCPLCGSMDHPAADEATSRPKKGATKAGRATGERPSPLEEIARKVERVEEALNAKRDEVKAALDRAVGHANAAARARERLENLRPEIARKEGEWRKRLEALEVLWLDSPLLARSGVVRAAMAIASAPSARNADATLSRAIEAFENERDALKARLSEDEALARTLEEARVAEDRADEEKRAVIKLVDRVRARVDEERRKVSEITAGSAREDALAEETERMLAGVFERVDARRAAGPAGPAEARGWKQAFARDPPAFIAACKRDVEAYEQALRAQQELERSLRDLAHGRSRAEAELRVRAEERARATAEADAGRARAASLAEGRRALLGGRRADEVARELQAALDAARRELESASTLERALAEQLAARDASARSASQALTAAGESAIAAVERLEAELAASSLAGEAAPREVLGRLLAHDAAWIRESEAQIARARDALTRLESALEDRMEQLADLSAGEQIDREGAKARLEASLARCDESDRRLITAIEAEARAKSQLAIDDEARAEIAHLRPEIERQRARCDRWAELSSLIGSADGKKLRGFAQGLTLDALLSQANLHLEQLRPRYRLGRVPGFDMELEVIDGDMGDEVRAVATLSGGETFLVSLALALGLSSLSAKNVTIRSLFIDEGFGSLDKEALEAALATLDQLQAEGRTIGLISHMPDVAERIGYQVHVRPTGPGRSEVVVLA